MKTLLFYSILFLLSLQSCLQVDASSQTISFWTDTIIDPDVEYTLFINNEEVGQMSKSYESVLCNMVGLVNVKIEDDMDMNLEVRGDNGEIAEIGIINLAGVSTGLVVKPNVVNTIFIEYGIDDPCILTRIRW